MSSKPRIVLRRGKLIVALKRQMNSSMCVCVLITAVVPCLRGWCPAGRSFLHAISPIKGVLLYLAIHERGTVQVGNLRGTHRSVNVALCKAQLDRERGRAEDGKNRRGPRVDECV